VSKAWLVTGIPAGIGLDPWNKAGRTARIARYKDRCGTAQGASIERTPAARLPDYRRKVDG